MFQIMVMNLTQRTGSKMFKPKTNLNHNIYKHAGIVYFTVVCSETWPLSTIEAGGDLVLTHTSLFFLCKCGPVSITTT